MLSRKRQDETPATGERDGQAASAPDRFERRRADIIAAAIPVLNGHGFKGMRLTAVAELIGLRATGVTYYFPRKEELAVACLESGYAVFDELLDQAEKAPDGASRIATLIDLFVARDAAVRRGEAMPLSSFAAIRALEGEHRDRVVEGYKRMFRRVRALLDSPELGHIDRVGRTIRALVLMEQLFWANVWLGDYDLDHFPRLAQRMTDIVVSGLMPAGATADLGNLQLRSADEHADAAKESFLMAASRQINEHGYRGASVDRISAALNVTKGAFYHHNEAKDDLVAACFRRSFGIARDAQRQVRDLPGSELQRLVSRRRRPDPLPARPRRPPAAHVSPLLDAAGAPGRDHVAVLQGQPAILVDDRRRRRRWVRPRRRSRRRRRNAARRNQRRLRHAHPHHLARVRHCRPLRPRAVRRPRRGPDAYSASPTASVTRPSRSSSRAPARMPSSA